MNYHGECNDSILSAQELGSILHLADIGDVDANSIKDNGILNYRKDADCGEGCEGISDGWVSTSPIDVGRTSLDILGSDADGKMVSLMPPTDTTTFSYLAWAAQKNKAMGETNCSIHPSSKRWQGGSALYLDENTGEIVIVRRDA